MRQKVLFSGHNLLRAQSYKGRWAVAQWNRVEDGITRSVRRRLQMLMAEKAIMKAKKLHKETEKAVSGSLLQKGWIQW